MKFEHCIDFRNSSSIITGTNHICQLVLYGQPSHFASAAVASTTTTHNTNTAIRPHIHSNFDHHIQCTIQPQHSINNNPLHSAFPSLTPTAFLILLPAHLLAFTPVHRSSRRQLLHLPHLPYSDWSSAVDSLVARWLLVRTRSWERRRRVAHVKRQQNNNTHTRLPHLILTFIHSLHQSAAASTSAYRRVDSRLRIVLDR